MPKSIAEIRAELDELGNISHTSIAFQDDILRIIETKKDRGGCVIEVGCYRGGLTAQIATVCQTLQKQFYAVDINANYLSVAKDSVARAVEQDNTNYFVGNLTEFYASGILVDDPILVFLDGDHRYPGVVKDITAILESKRPPYAVAFHDFSLRYVTPELADVRVDRAIHDNFGAAVHLDPLGEIAGSGQTARTEPQPDGHYHEIGQPEGVLLLYKEMRAAAHQLHRLSGSSVIPPARWPGSRMLPWLRQRIGRLG